MGNLQSRQIIASNQQKNQQIIAIISDETFDHVFVYKLYSNPTLLESLKRIENIEIFTTLERFCVDELQVSIFYY